MADRKVYHIVPDTDIGTWRIEFEGSERASRMHATKDRAIETARGLAESSRPSQVIVHKEDGSIQTEWTYGDDPYPPAG